MAFDPGSTSSLIEGIIIQDNRSSDRTVLVFRTSVNDDAGVDALRPALDDLVGRSGRWTFDLDDQDHVLRIETDGANAEEVIRLLGERGEQCYEL